MLAKRDEEELRKMFTAHQAVFEARSVAAKIHHTHWHSILQVEEVRKEKKKIKRRPFGMGRKVLAWRAYEMRHISTTVMRASHTTHA